MERTATNAVKGVHAFGGAAGFGPTRMTCTDCGFTGLQKDFRPVTVVPGASLSKRAIYVYSGRCLICLERSTRGLDAHTQKGLRQLWSRARSGAPARGMLFGLAPEDVMALWNAQGGKCALTGRTMTLTGGMTAASIDRIDSQGGYTADNVWLVCWAVNLMKQAMTVEEFGDWCKAIVFHALERGEAA